MKLSIWDKIRGKGYKVAPRTTIPTSAITLPLTSEPLISKILHRALRYANDLVHLCQMIRFMEGRNQNFIVWRRPEPRHGIKELSQLDDFDVTLLERDGRLGLAAFSTEHFGFVMLGLVTPHGWLCWRKKYAMKSRCFTLFFYQRKKTMKERIFIRVISWVQMITSQSHSTVKCCFGRKPYWNRNDDVNKEQENKEEFDLELLIISIQKIKKLNHNGQMSKHYPENGVWKCFTSMEWFVVESSIEKIWGQHYVFNGRSMDVYCRKLRKYLKEDSNIEIVNIHGNGLDLLSLPGVRGSLESGIEIELK